MLELLAPAGDLECLQSAVDNGCNAVYLGGKIFGMRASSKNFNEDDLKKAVDYAHSKGVKVHLTCNTLPTNDEISLFPEFIKNAQDCGVDAVIVCDIGLMSMVKEYAPKLEIHVSTQTGVVNYCTANEFYKMGAKRVVLAREVGIEEIKKIRANIPKDMEIETFVHGAMCVSFSGRCLISAYLNDRNANRGECSQPCRWKYSLVEERRPDQYYPIEEDEKGTYILNARDLCMIEYLRELIEAGVTSFKIEGRAKSSYYVATITNAYRAALAAAQNGEAAPKWAVNEVFKISHRQYCTGFFFSHPNACQYYKDSGYIREYDFVGVVDGYEDGNLLVTQRNYFTTNDKLEIVAPMCEPVVLQFEKLINSDGIQTEIANRATEKLKFVTDMKFPPRSILRKPSKDCLQ